MVVIFSRFKFIRKHLYLLTNEGAMSVIVKVGFRLNLRENRDLYSYIAYGNECNLHMPRQTVSVYYSL